MLTQADLIILSNALDFYKTRGYREVELYPMCNELAYSATSPFEKGSSAYEANRLVGYPFEFLVASGEQSFIDATIQGSLSSDNLYIGTTGCFRPELDRRMLKFPYFTKSELYLYTKSASKAEEAFQRMANDALAFMSHTHHNLAMILTADGLDIISKKEGKFVELGSYGQRYSSSLGIHWAYGTGVAVPRFRLV